MASNDLGVITRVVAGGAVGAVSQAAIDRAGSKAEQAQLATGGIAAVVGGALRFFVPKKAQWARNVGEGLLVGGGTVLSQAGTYATDRALMRRASSTASTEPSGSASSSTSASSASANASSSTSTSSNTSSTTAPSASDNDSDDLASAFGG